MKPASGYSSGHSLRLVPITKKGGSAKKNFKGTPFIRNTAEYEIILKLGKIQGYDDNRQILGSDGAYIPGTDVIMLVNEAMTPKRVLNGLEDFIKLLSKAKIDPDIIVNDNIRSKFNSYKRRKRDKNSDSISIPPEEIVRVTEATQRNIIKNKPRTVLQRINLDDYRHLLNNKDK